MKKKALNWLMVTSLVSTALPGSFVFAEETTTETSTSMMAETNETSGTVTPPVESSEQPTQTTDETDQLADSLADESSNQKTAKAIFDQFVTINGKSPLLESSAALSSKKATYKAKSSFIGSDGRTYLDLYDHTDRRIGSIHESGVTIAAGEQGSYNPYNQYVALNGSYPLWDGFEWNTSISSANYLNQTFHATGIYYHFNGSTYLSLYDNQGTWIGYINQAGVNGAPGPHGVYARNNQYVALNGKYSVWDGFEWKKSTPAKNYLNQTFHATGIYYHFNGSTYLSLYDNKGKWIGYVNRGGVEIAAGQQGIYTPANQHIVVNGRYDLWENFAWKKKKSGKNYLNQTLRVAAVYYHFNGSTYLSVYDSQGKWIGYMNERGTKIAVNERIDYSEVYRGKVHLAFDVRSDSPASKMEVRAWSKSNQSDAKNYPVKKVNNRYEVTIDHKNHNYNIGMYQVEASLYTADGKKTVFALPAIELTNPVLADKTASGEYLRDVLPIAQEVAKQHKLFPSVMIAQSVLESGYGSSTLAKEAWNFFGMKFKVGEDEGKYGIFEIDSKEYDKEKDEWIVVKSPFRKYETKKQSFEDNALKLTQGVSWDPNYYSGTWRANAKNYKEATAGLQGRYATDPAYSSKLNDIIEHWELDIYD